MSEPRIRTSLQGKVPATPLSDEELRAKACHLWHQTGTIMVREEWFKNDWDKQFAQNLAKGLFGPRKVKA
jgi:hypothetical protein